MSVVMTSPTSGFVVITVYETKKARSTRVPFRATLRGPPGHVIMLSFAKFDAMGGCAYHKFLELYTEDTNGSKTCLWRSCGTIFAEAYVYDMNTIKMLIADWWRHLIPPSRFKMRFSFHPESRVPQRLSSGLYNCSVDHYWRFRQHLDCNTKAQCEDGRDEGGHCPFSSPACNGWVASRHKCFKFVSEETLHKQESSENNLYMNAVQHCASFNATVGKPLDHHELHTLSQFGDYLGRRIQLFVSLFIGGRSVPNMYRDSIVADDRTVLHYTFGRYKRISFRRRKKLRFIFRYFSLFRPTLSTMPNSQFQTQTRLLDVHTTCEFTTKVDSRHHNKAETLSLPDVSFALKREKQSLTRCHNGQITHTFLSCYPHNECRQGTLPPCTFKNTSLNNVHGSFARDGPVTSVPVFTCDDDITRLSYILVCDFRQDCPDQSDEWFCSHPPCDGFPCTNGQCVRFGQRCDILSDCTDDSDEIMCSGDKIISFKNTIQRSFRSPVLIKFDGIRLFTLKAMNSNESCPDTHYRCPGEHNDCLPVYTRCNGLYDCVDHEDEDGCEDSKITCPDFYRCFMSTVCLHADHLCDGWPHCPQGDDEWLCDMTCPAGCLCQGHTFLCRQPFSAHLFPQLRYLDAKGSGMTPSAVNENRYIVYLSLSQCSLTVLPVMKSPNLQFLDLSVNDLHAVNMSVFGGLVNLQSLTLAKNPLHHIHSDPASDVQQRALKTIDLSFTTLTVFDTRAMSSFVNVQRLNISFTTIHTVSDIGFRYTPRLTHMYMEGSPVETFPADVIKVLSLLRVLVTDNYKLCCQEILPNHFEFVTCDAPNDEISSCEDLLQSGIYRGFLWIVSFLSLLGNLFCFVARVCVQRTASTSGFHVFVTNLSMADFLMGVYIAIIGVADVLFRGKYLFYDDTWTHSVACQVAGFLSLLSCEVSALIIWLITLDRFIVLHFPFSRLRFQRTSAIVACLITWLAGFSLALVPLLPVTSHWEFFSKTGICIPLPVTRQDFKGRVYSVSVFIVLNFILFLLIATGQAFIYWSVQKNALKTDTTKDSAKDMTIARRLISVAVTDFLCWFPIGLCALLAMAGTPIPGEMNVALAVFVLPLNSALNPFMYTFNMLMEKRRKSKEALLLKWLELHTDLVKD